MQDIPGERLESRVRAINLWPDTEQAHQCVAVISGKMLGGIAVMQAFESKRDQLELAENQVSLVMVDELRGLAIM